MPDMTDFTPSPCRDMMPGNEVLPLTGQTHILAGNKKRDYMRRIIIMGATSGIGMEVAKLFIADSCINVRRAKRDGADAKTRQ